MEDRSLDSYIIEGKRALVIPDVHMDIKFVKSILKKHDGDYDKLVFLGDFFDSYKRPPEIAGAKEMVNFIHELKYNYGAIFLVGNHDMAYYEDWFYKQKNKGRRNTLNFSCSGFSQSRSSKIAKNLNLDVIKESKLVMLVNGWLLSHAGLHAGLMPYSGSDNESLRKLFKKCEIVWDMFPYVEDSLFSVGTARGGNAAKGGVTWQDWNEEFEDELPWPQVVGHTFTYTSRPSRIGRSYCIDCGQTNYAIIGGDGKIEFGI